MRIPAVYRTPYGTPLFWMDEVSGRLGAAVMAYLRAEALDDVDLQLLVDYCAYWIEAPCWREASDGTHRLAEVRRRIRHVVTREGLGRWLTDASALGIDPL